MSSLSDVVALHARDTDISEAYEYQLNYAIKRFRLFLSREPTVADLSEELTNTWLQDEQRSGSLSARSRANLRRSIQTIWKAAAERDLATAVGSLRPVKVPESNPEAWDFGELQLVAEAASELPGKLPNKVPRSWYFTALIWYSFESGLRRSDCFAFDIRRVRGTAGVHTQSKTGRSHGYALTNETTSELQRIADLLRSKSDPRWFLPLRYPGSASQVYYWIRRCRSIAGVDPDTPNRSLQHLRRTGATQVEIDSPMTAWRYLGHSTGPTLSRKSYIDRRLANTSIMPSRNRSCSRPKIHSESENDARAS